MPVWSLGQEDPLEEDMATHSVVLAWEISWAEEPGRLSPWGRKKSALMTKQQPPLFFHLCWLPGSKPNSSMPASEHCLGPFLHPPGPLCRAMHLPSSLLWSSLLPAGPCSHWPASLGFRGATGLDPSPTPPPGSEVPGSVPFWKVRLLLDTHLPSHLSQCRPPGSAWPRPQ